METKITTINNTYFLQQYEKSQYTTIERIGNLTNTFKGESIIKKNIFEVTENDIINLTYLHF